MAGFDDDLRKIIRRNKLFGMWAAEKLGLRGADATAYSDALAMDALDPQRSDVFNKIRKDFGAAGVVQSDELFLKAGDPTYASRGGSLDAAAVRIAKNLSR